MAATTFIDSVTVGIVTYNSAPTIRQTLDSLIAANAARAVVIFLRDNGSRDGTLTILADYARRDERIKLVGQGDNIGFGSGHNEILRSHAGSVHIICNPDIVVRQDFFDISLTFLVNNPDVGLMSPKMVGSAGDLQHSNRRHPTVLDLALRRFAPRALQTTFARRIEHYEMADVGYQSVYDVPFCSGALMVCRRDALVDVGGFDDRYFLYFEDADLSRMMQQSGWRTVFNPAVEVVHGWQRGGHRNLRLTAVMTANAFRYFGKWGWRWL